MNRHPAATDAIGERLSCALGSGEVWVERLTPTPTLDDDGSRFLCVRSGNREVVVVLTRADCERLALAVCWHPSTLSAHPFAQGAGRTPGYCVCGMAESHPAHHSPGCEKPLK